LIHSLSLHDPLPISVERAQPVRTLERSIPYKMVIKKISLWTMIDQIGLKPDGRIETPPYEKADRAAWYRNSPTPGEAGPAIILGHVDSKERIAAFFYLSRIRPGDSIEIVRTDRSTAVFEVDSVEQFAKANFPTDRVYGPTDEATLRLVTCGGRYDIRRQSYVDNIVVFATMIDFRPSPAPRR
ncbi:MAG TPA: hypothetical protein DGG94_00905, partial [Micromonosporaceae bacterium]|nr:hypothetical protein [Micromonosporaceae bacterium]